MKKNLLRINCQLSSFVSVMTVKANTGHISVSNKGESKEIAYLPGFNSIRKQNNENKTSVIKRYKKKQRHQSITIMQQKCVRLHSDSIIIPSVSLLHTIFYFSNFQLEFWFRSPGGDIHFPIFFLTFPLLFTPTQWLNFILQIPTNMPLHSC